MVDAKRDVVDLHGGGARLCDETDIWQDQANRQKQRLQADKRPGGDVEGSIRKHRSDSRHGRPDLEICDPAMTTLVLKSCFQQK